jgi:hypothetical protein
MQINKRRRWRSCLAGVTCFFLPLALLPTDGEFTTLASWYGPGFQGRTTASGERFDQNKMTAASRTLPFGTKVTVKNLRNGRTCNVVINDRGPFVRGRGIDLSHEAARRLNIGGVAPVTCYIGDRTEHVYTPPDVDNETTDVEPGNRVDDGDDLSEAIPVSNNPITRHSILHRQPVELTTEPISLSNSPITRGSILHQQAVESAREPIPNNPKTKDSFQDERSADFVSEPIPVAYSEGIQESVQQRRPADFLSKPTPVTYRTDLQQSIHHRQAAHQKAYVPRKQKPLYMLSHKPSRHAHNRSTTYVAYKTRERLRFGHTLNRWTNKIAHLCRGFKSTILATL